MHVGRLWDGSGALLAAVTFSGESGSGWQTAHFSSPVSVAAGQTYSVSYHAPNGGYAVTTGFFSSSYTSGADPGRAGRARGALVRQQQIEAQARERLEQEPRVARVVQQTLLPKDLPELAGWQVAAYWQPAQAVSGDFYDFINLPDGNLGIVEADVTGKGVPAALVMASATRHLARCGRAGSSLARQGPGARQRAALPRHPAQHVRDVPVRRAQPAHRALCLRQRRP